MSDNPIARRRRLVEAASEMAKNPTVEGAGEVGQALADVIADLLGKECMVVALFKQDEKESLH